MNLPTWLEPWWRWWADFTDLFNWDALGVVALSIGGFWALWNWASANISSRRRDAANIQRAVIPIAAVVKSYKGVMESIVKDQRLKEHMISYLETKIFSQQSEYLNHIRNSGLPSVLANDITNASYSQMVSMEYFIKCIIESEADEEIEINIKNVYSCFEHLAAFGWQLEREVEKIAGSVS